MGRPARGKEIDWEAVQRDRDAGTPVSELVKKYGVQSPSIYTKTHGSADGKAARRGVRKKAAAGAGRNGHANGAALGNGNGGAKETMLAVLHGQREKIDRAIEAIEALEG